MTLLLGLLLAGGACSPGGIALRAESLGDDPVFLEGEYVTAFYAVSEATETSFFIADVPVEEILSGRIERGLVVHLDLLWTPSAGRTPMDSSATNVSIRYVVFADGEVGVYGGAGFAVPYGRSGQPTMALALEDASLTLLDATGGFVDKLSPARLTGTVIASHDERQARRIQFAVSQMVTNALGRSHLVRAAGGDATSRAWSSTSSSSSSSDAWPAP